ncbi:leucine--tRNA ligase [Candidatus Woesearchaeota archaeon]|nr:leucine--tRNA ligase [Candidatus Woesearchaeota archaeon]
MAHEEVQKRESKWQKLWSDKQAFEANPDKRQKFFCTFPYPYVNGLPHIGHTFTMMRVDAFARYMRSQGRNVLFPQAWHATGTPISAAAERVADGEEKQIKILKDFGVEDSELKSFEKPEHWIKYFAPRYKRDVQKLGMSIDWRREFITTNLNPHYDAFIRWQFLVLKDKGYVKKGKHPVVWCPKMNTPVGDHDRISGEGETPQEFVLVKHKLPDGRFMVSATLRPDTILGLTNTFVNPDAEYTEVDVDGETWILGEPGAKRLAQQGFKVTEKGTVKGSDLVGQKTKEFGDREVLVLPATFLDAKVGTGLVHSVPSESADDLIALQNLQADAGFCKKHGLDMAEVSNIHPIEILDTPEIGKNPAQFYLDKYEVKSQNERKKLDQIRKELYKHSFYNATFSNKYKAVFDRNLTGVPIQEAMSYVTDQLVEAGWAVRYYELTGPVVTRANVDAIVKVVENQWFVTYSDLEWKEQTHKAIKATKFYPESVRAQFEHVVNWLNNWACTREHGMGTRLPWDDQWLIESLSDSTIYMAYYTVAHKIEEVPLEQLNKKFFDYLFLGKGEKPAYPGIDKLRDEFLYWYPLDFRNSGKDLVQNHLTFMLFHHCAIFPEEHWPRSIGVNGWVTVDGQKMSKSLGNVIPVETLLEEYGADATRITILNGGEGMDDPNWDSSFAKGMGPKLEGLLRQATDLKDYKRGNDTPADAWLHSRLHEVIRDVSAAMERTDFRTAIQLSLFELGQVVKWYQARVKVPNKGVLREVLEAQLLMLQPFIPHTCEEAWEILGNDGFISHTKWPAYDSSRIDPGLDEAENMIRDLVDKVRKSGSKDVTIYLAAEWKRKAYEEFDKVVEKSRNPFDITKALMATPLKQHGDELQRLIKFLVKGRIPSYVPTEKDERAWLASAEDFLAEIAGSVKVLEAGEGDSPKKNSGLPGKPALG